MSCLRITEKLILSVTEMNSLEDISMHPSQYCFCNVRVLHVYECPELTSILTVNVASSLKKLESLRVSECPVLRYLVQGENSGAKVINFPKLKVLNLNELPILVSLCDIGIVMELPQLVELILHDLPNVTSIFPENKSISAAQQPLLNTKVVIPKLERLTIYSMENLKEIWASENTSISEEDANNKISMLREIEVKECRSLVNLFPINPMQLLTHSDSLLVRDCPCIEVLFNIDVGCIGEIENGVSTSLRSIEVRYSDNLRSVWRITGGDENNYSGLLIRGFQGVQSIVVISCNKFRNIITPSAIYFDIDMGALTDITIGDCGGTNESVTTDSQNQRRQIIPISKEEISKVNSANGICVVAFPSNLIRTFRHLPEIYLQSYNGVEVVFEIQSPSSKELVVTKTNQQPSLPTPCNLTLWNMDTMTHVWKCSNWNEFLSLQNQHPQSSLHNLTTIRLLSCKSIKYLFSPLMVKLLSSLKHVTIYDCDGMEEVVSNRDNDEETTASTSTHTTTTLLPHLDSLSLEDLPSLKHVGGGGTTDFIKDQLKYSRDGVLCWSLCQYSRDISIRNCDALSSVIPFHVAGQMMKVEVLKIKNCILMKEVFAAAQISSKSDEGRGDTNTVLAIQRPGNVTTHKLSNLTMMHIDECGSLEHVFTFSTLESLVKLEELRIKRCKEMKVIVREENGEQTTASKVVVFPRLKAIELVLLPNLEGFFLGMNEFQFPLLDNVMIVKCPNLLTLTSSKSTAPRLRYIHSIFGKYRPECYNLYVTITSPQTPSPSLDSTSSCPTILHQSLSLNDTIEVNTEDIKLIEEVFASNELLQLTNLEKIHVKRCEEVETVFEEVALEVTDSEFNNESQTVVNLPNLREVDLMDLPSLKYIWKSNRWMRLEFPNLTRVSIDHCIRLRYVFTSSMVGSLMHLQDLHITNCFCVSVIIIKEEKDEGNAKEEESGGKVNEIIMLPCLKSLTLDDLWNLKGFYLGKELDFSLPSLNIDTLVIKRCPNLITFTRYPCRVAAPELKVIETNKGLIDVGEHDINSFIITKKQEKLHFEGNRDKLRKMD